MFSAVYDAVRIAERESQSAMPTAPVTKERKRAQPARVFTARRVASEQLHRFAEAIAPNREFIEPGFTPNQRAGCCFAPVRGSRT